MPSLKTPSPKIAEVLMRVSTPLKWGRPFSENDKNVDVLTSLVKMRRLKVNGRRKPLKKAM
jgi:hypothetical protein